MRTQWQINNLSATVKRIAENFISPSWTMCVDESNKLIRTDSATHASGTHWRKAKIQTTLSDSHWLNPITFYESNYYWLLNQLHKIFNNCIERIVDGIGGRMSIIGRRSIKLGASRLISQLKTYAAPPRDTSMRRMWLRSFSMANNVPFRSVYANRLCSSSADVNSRNTIYKVTIK